MDSHVRLVKRQPHVLVAEDEEHIASVITFLLKDEGYRVSCARDGWEALRIAERDRPDLIVTDLMMPVMDGAALIAAVRADTALRDVPILVASCIEQPRLRPRIQGYLTKPFELDEIVTAVRRLCPNGPQAERATGERQERSA